MDKTDNFSFSVFPNEELLNFRLFQTGWEQCTPLHSFGPFIRNHYLFHYVISGRGFLDATAEDGTVQRYDLEAGQGFLISPGQINMYSADQAEPWKYVWLEFDGLRATEYLNEAGLSTIQPIYRPRSMEQAQEVQDIMMYIAGHSKCSTLHLIGCADSILFHAAGGTPDAAPGLLCAGSDQLYGAPLPAQYHG